MANANANVKSLPINIFGILGNALLWVWNGLVYVGENSARARMVRQINSMSDDQLASLGMTRAEMVKRLISDGYHL